MLEETAIPSEHPGESPSDGVPLSQPTPDAVVQALLRHHPIEAAKALGLSVTALAALARRPEIQQDLDTLRELALDHAARERQAAQSLAMQALSEILTKRNDEGANLVEVRRAASALSRLASGRWDRPPHWDRPRSDRVKQAEAEPEEPNEEPDDELDDDDEPADENREDAPVSDEAKALIAAAVVTRVLEKLQNLENPTPEAALEAIQGHIVPHRNKFDWIADFQHTRFLTYRNLPRFLDHPTIHWKRAFVRVRYRGHESEETWIRLWDDGGPDAWRIQTFRPDSS